MFKLLIVLSALLFQGVAPETPIPPPATPAGPQIVAPQPTPQVVVVYVTPEPRKTLWDNPAWVRMLLIWAGILLLAGILFIFALTSMARHDAAVAAEAARQERISRKKNKTR